MQNKNVAIKLKWGVDKASVAGPLKKNIFSGFHCETMVFIKERTNFHLQRSSSRVIHIVDIKFTKRDLISR